MQTKDAARPMTDTGGTPHRETPARGLARSMPVPTIALALALGLASAADAQFTLHVAGFTEVSQLPTPTGIPGPLGDILISDDGTTALILGAASTASSAVYTASVLRAVDNTITGFGTPTLVFAYADIETSIEFKVGTDTLFFRGFFGVGERTPDGTITEFSTPSTVAEGGLILVPPVLPNGGEILIGNWSSGEIYAATLADNGDGTFTPTETGLFSQSEAGANGDMLYVCGGPFEQDLMITNWSGGTVSVIDLDLATGLPLPSAAAPTITLFASGLGVGPWSLEVDPITGNLLIINWNGTPSNGIVQVSGLTDCPVPVELMTFTIE